MEEKATTNGTGKPKGRTKQQASVSKVQEAGTATIAPKPKPKANAKTKVIKQAVKEEEEEAAVLAVKQEEEESSEEDDVSFYSTARRFSASRSPACEKSAEQETQEGKKPEAKAKVQEPPNVKSEEPPVQLKTEPVVKPNAVKSTKSKANKEIAKVADKGKGKTRGKEKSSRVEPQAPPNLSVPRKIVVIETEAIAILAKSLPHPSDITNKVTPPLLSKAKEPSNGSEDAPPAVSNPSRNSSREDTSHTNVKSQPDVLSRILFSNHPPRPFVYSPIELNMFDGLTWKDDIQGRMELSAIGWIAGAAYRAWRHSSTLLTGITFWTLASYPPQVLDHDLRMHLYADMELPFWFTELLQLPAQIDERPSEQPSIVLPNLEV
ncbi:hypothetical protein A0H81_06677 [Grifola frondosa]|uniref:Uncharacterized protein n=1 Tax=Grifola frondosa TaxID=5627 RepID=A0A1C7M8C2_GRIFR|nr:hypothetical protein A0H81_06677 [Grifola frondosa]